MSRGSRLRVVLALGSAQTLAWGSSYYLPAILAVPIARELGLGTGTVFAAFSLALALTALLGPAAGRRIDRLGGRDVLALSNLVFAAGLVLLGTAQGPALLVVAWMVLGVGMALGLYDAAFSTLAGIYGREARGAITGITLIAGLASTVAWPITALLEAQIGWRGACFAWAAAHLLLGLPLNRLLVPLGTQPLPAGGTVPPLRAGVLLSDRAMLLLAFVFAVTWFTSTAMAAHLPRLLQEAGASPTAAITAAALVGPAQVAGRLLEFGVLQRFHPLLSARLAAAAHPLGAAILMVMGAPAAFAFAAIHGAGNGILTIAKGTLPLAIFGPTSYGLRQGLLSIPARFAQATAPFLFALLIERYGPAALLVSALLGVGSVAALMAIDRPAAVERA
jgi:predicted MFS family arabinose efflux permease